MKNFSISVVLPAHNEEDNIEKTVLDCLVYLEKKFTLFELVVVNDGSSDKTKQVVEKISSENPNVKLINHEINKGYGSALRSGFEASNKEYIFFMDSDGQFDINDLDVLLENFSEKNSEAIIGYRKKRSDSFIRKLNQYLYHQYIRLFFGLNVKDIDCAFKFFPMDAYNKIKPLRSDGALFSAEMLIKFKNSGVQFKEVSVNHYTRKFGDSSGANINVIIKMFIESWKYRKELRL